CKFPHTRPSEGIAVAHRGFCAGDLRAGDRLLLACVGDVRQQPEFNGLHPYAQLCLSQNPLERMLVNPDPLWEFAFIPFWPQPGLLPRDPARGTKFENVAYFGWPQNLADPLHESALLMRLAG